MPCRSASASLPVAIWNSSLRRDQRGHRGRRRAVHPDLAVPVQRHEPPRGVDDRVHHGQVEPVALGDRTPVVDAGAAQRIGADADAGRPDRVEVHHVGQVVDVGAQEVVRAARRPGPGRSGTRRTPLSPARSSSLARSAIQPVASVSAGPPFGGLYLKPPSRGGLCDGVTTMPSARPASVVPAVVRRGSRGRPPAWGCTGRRRRPAPVTPLAASTSSAVAQAGSDRPWVSRPTNSGPSKPCAARYSQMAWVVARMCASLNAASRLEPAVPGRAERDLLATSAGSGSSV